MVLEGEIVEQKAGPGRRPHPGRPTLFDQQRAATIIQFLEVGNYLPTAAAAAGVKEDTLRDWLTRGANGDTEELVEFAARVSQSRSVSSFTPAAAAAVGR